MESRLVAPSGPSASKVRDPHGLEQYETLASCNCVWLSHPTFPLKEGSNYRGNVVLPLPRDIGEMVRKYTLPAFRKGTGAKVVECVPMPEVEKLLARQAGGAKVAAARVRVAYKVDGKEVQEDLYLGIDASSADIGYNCICTIWGPAFQPFAIRAAKGELDTAIPPGYGQAGSGPNRTVILSNDRNFDPHQYETGTWKELRPLR